MENFNLKKFLVENKLTTNSRILSENEQEHGFKNFDGYDAFHIGTAGGAKIYRLDDSDVFENCTYVWEYPNDTTHWTSNMIDIDVSGQPVSSEELQEYDDLEGKPEIADFIAADIARKLKEENPEDDEDSNIQLGQAHPDFFSNDIRVNPSLNERRLQKIKLST